VSGPRSWTGYLMKQPRYYLQHRFGFQVHDAGHPHLIRQHGRAHIGWKPEPDEQESRR
jgi:hypothetical protein